MLDLNLRDTNRGASRLDNPFGTIEEPAFELFKNLCGQYEWCTDVWGTRMRKLIEALIVYFDWYEPNVSREMIEMYESAIEDARIGRGHAEIENMLRDEPQAQQQADTE